MYRSEILKNDSFQLNREDYSRFDQLNVGDEIFAIKKQYAKEVEVYKIISKHILHGYLINFVVKGQNVTVTITTIGHANHISLTKTHRIWFVSQLNAIRRLSK